MKNLDVLSMLDMAHKNAYEMGAIIEKHVPTECRIALLDALLAYSEQKTHGADVRLFRTFESGLLAGITGKHLERALDQIGLPRSRG